MPLQRLKRSLQELGTFEGAMYVTAGIISRLTAGRCRLIRYHIVAQPVPAAAMQAARPAGSHAIEKIDRHAAVVESFPRPPAVIARRFDDGAVCFVAMAKGRFAGFLWLARHHYDEDEVRCRFDLVPPERCAWDYDVYVEPDFRIGRTFARLWDAANAYLHAQGVQWSLSRISAFNPVSLAAHRRLGIRKLSSATFLLIGKLQVSIFTTAPFIHLGWNDRMRPVLQVRAPALTPPPHTLSPS